MLHFFSLWRNRWLPSEFASVRAIDIDAVSDAQRHDYLLLARALARLLALCTPRGAQRDFGAALRAHRLLKAQLRDGATLHLPPQLLSDLSHEIAPYAPRAAREAALRCLHRGSAARRDMRFA